MGGFPQGPRASQGIPAHPRALANAQGSRKQQPAPSQVACLKLAADIVFLFLAGLLWMCIHTMYIICMYIYICTYIHITIHVNMDENPCISKWYLQMSVQPLLQTLVPPMVPGSQSCQRIAQPNRWSDQLMSTSAISLNCGIGEVMWSNVKFTHQNSW